MDDSDASYDEGQHQQLRSFLHRNVKRLTDKADRATTETVLDPRTRLMLFKMLNNGTLSEINGCISTGKEANVYSAVAGDGTQLAVKIYKTSILVFKDRDRYVRGEYRFRNGYNRSNPRKMVKMWAEKEMRNLKRLQAASIPCPEAVCLKGHILVMTLIGKEDVAAPRLKDAELTSQQAETAYWQLVSVIRQLYQNCRLVHADLSEYNILYFRESCFLIDVSQSVENAHPSSLDFLRSDCSNVNSFFRSRGCLTLSLRELFDFVTASTFESDQRVEEELSALRLSVKNRPAEFAAKEAASDNVFRHSFIPKRLDEVIDAERDVEVLMRGSEEPDFLYRKISAISIAPESKGEQIKGEFSSDDSSSESSSSSSTRFPLTEEQLKGQRKHNKKLVKQQNRERRQCKMKKSEKARLIKRSNS